MLCQCRHLPDVQIDSAKDMNEFEDLPGIILMKRHTQKEGTQMKHKIKHYYKLLAALLAASVISGSLMGCGYCEATDNAQAFEEEQAVTVIAPTCTEAGYTLHTGKVTGITTISDEVPAPGHQFGEWQTDENGNKSRICDVCGFEEWREQQKIARMHLYGETAGISKNDCVTLRAEFDGKGQNFSCYASVSLQGHSTLGLEKKNYTVRFYDDAELNGKHKMSFESWNLEHKYVLKANYYDPSQCRNLLCANLWADIVKERNDLPRELTMTSNYGAVDGFPCAVWLNDSFMGLYTMNLHKDDDLYAMPLGEHNAVMIANAQTGDESLFKAEAGFVEDVTDWEVEYCSTHDSAWAEDSFNALIRFIMNSTEEEFYEDLSEYLDVDAAIDYLIFIYAAGLTDSYAKDLVMLNYGTRWIPTVYDMEDAFGLTADGAGVMPAESFLPFVSSSGLIDSSTGSLLWDRLLNSFSQEISDRYRALRDTVLDEASFENRVKEYLNQIPEEYYAMDRELYPDMPEPGTPAWEQITDYFSARIILLDQFFTEMGENKK